METQDTFSKYATVFDDHFGQNIWGKIPAQIQLPCNFEVCSEEHLVEALRRYSIDPATLKKNNSLAEFVTAIDNVKTDVGLSDFAVRETEKELDSYLNRVDHVNRNREWSIAYFGLHGASSTIWDAAKQFVDALSSAVGFQPGGRVDVDCFIGRYSSTPSGIHVDDAHNFGFTFRSGKTMFTWPGSRKELCWLKSPHYDQFKKDSRPLENNVGYVCYFPHDALHVGETTEKVSVNLNISLWQAADDSQQNINYLVSHLKSLNITEKPLSRSGKTQLPEVDHENLNTLREILLSGQLERQVALSHLVAQTSGGMKVPRPVFDDCVFDTEKNFRLREIATLQWYETESLKELFISANGNCISCAYDDEVVEFLNFLSKKSEQGFNKMNLRGIRKSSYSEFKDLALLLYKWGAIEEVS